MPSMFVRRTVKARVCDRPAELPMEVGCAKVCSYTKRRRAAKLHLRSALQWSLNCPLRLYFFLMRTLRVTVPVLTMCPVLVTRILGILTLTYAIFTSLQKTSERSVHAVLVVCQSPCSLLSGPGARLAARQRIGSLAELGPMMPCHEITSLLVLVGVHGLARKTRTSNRG